jgi:hypothetical protein
MKNNLLKKHLSILFFILISFAVFANAVQAEDIDYLSWEDVKELGYTSPLVVTAVVDSTVYGLILEKNTVFSWNIGEKGIKDYMQYKPISLGREVILFKERSRKEQEALLNYPSSFFEKDSELWAFNQYSYKIGKIEPSGIEWIMQLDKANTNETYIFAKDFFAHGSYIFAKIKDTKKVYGTLQVWELPSGKGKELNVPGMYIALPYKEGQALAICNIYTEKPKFTVVDLATGTMNDLPVKMPFPCKDNSWDPLCESYPLLPFDGFVYDESSDTILFSAFGKLWASTNNSDFHETVEVSLSETPFPENGWILPDGRYAARSGAGVCIRNWK